MRRSKLLLPVMVLPLLWAVGCAKAPPTVSDKLVEAGAPAGSVLLWPLPQNTPELVAKAGLPQLEIEHDEFHLHVHLEVYKEGRQVVVPAYIGIDPQWKWVSPMHTHEPTGVIHVESPEVRKFTLGQFFTEWGVSLDGAKAVVNDEPVADPAAYEFSNLDLITVTFD